VNARFVTVALLGGGTMTVPCPPWCDGHPDALVEHDPADVAHDGPETALSVETGFGTVEILAAGISQAPYRHTGDRLPYCTVDMGGYEPMTPDQLRALADGLEQHAAFLRGFAVEVEQVRAAAAQARRPAGYPAHLPYPQPLDGGDRS
jgi:hypothetical protein